MKAPKMNWIGQMIPATALVWKAPWSQGTYTTIISTASSKATPTSVTKLRQSEEGDGLQ